MALTEQWKMAAEACYIEVNETNFTVEPIWKEYMETHPCEVAYFYELEKDDMKMWFEPFFDGMADIYMCYIKFYKKPWQDD